MTGRQGGSAKPDDTVRTNRYQLALASFLFPYLGHVAYAAVIAMGVVLLGHPKTALGFAAIAVGVDVGQQALTRHWLRRSANVEPIKGLRRLAVLCALRATAFLAPLAVMAARGGGPEILLFLLVAMAMLAMGFATSVVSRVVFWGFSLPVLGAVLAVVLSLKGWGPIGGGLTMLAGLAVLLTALSASISMGARQWLEKYDANVAMIPELTAARRRAEEARVVAEASSEEARRSDTAKSGFLAGMSHEIRTPMNGVLGMAQLLRRDETDPVKQGRLDMLLESGEHLLALLDDVVDLSKIDAGRVEIVTEPEPLRLFLDRLVGLWDARAEAKGLTLRLELGDSVPDTVLMDAVRVRQVLSNLISNALKFTETGHVDVVVTARAKDDDAMTVRITVRDTGPGIAPEHLVNLFQLYEQGEVATARRHGGAGLGLAIARQLTELMGGRIWVDSKPDVGSAFHVELPLALAVVVAKKAEAPAPKRKRAKVA